MTIDQTLTTESAVEKPWQLRARINFAIFAIVVVGIGWVGVAIDRAGGVASGTGSETSTSGSTNGQGLWILIPALTALALYFLSRDGAGKLGLTLRFRTRPGGSGSPWRFPRSRRR